MKTALEILKETHEEVSRPNPTDWQTFDEIMQDGTGDAMLRAMERYAEQEAKAYANWLSNTVIAGRTMDKLFRDYKAEIGEAV